MKRMGVYYSDPNSVTPKFVEYEVGVGSDETWEEGLNMYHNPNAKHPVPEELFPSIAHHYFIDGQIMSNLPEIHPFNTSTVVIRPIEDAE